MPVDQPPAECVRILEQAAPWPNPKDQEAVRRWSKLYERKAECARLSEASWAPIKEVAERGRQVRRATFNEGRLAFRIPAVALERSRDGAVWIRMSMDGPTRVFSAALPPETWARLTAMDAEARKPPKPLRRDGPQPIGCHGWFVTLEGADAKKSWRQDVSECTSDPNATAFAYGYELASLAIEHIAECASAKAKADAQDAKTSLGRQKPIWALIDCGGRFSPRTIDNP